jgi:hypothetical protein
MDYNNKRVAKIIWIKIEIVIRLLVEGVYFRGIRGHLYYQQQ